MNNGQQGLSHAHAEIRERTYRVNLVRNTIREIDSVLGAERFSKNIPPNVLTFIQEYRPQLEEMVTSQNYANLNIEEVTQLFDYLKNVIAGKAAVPDFIKNILQQKADAVLAEEQTRKDAILQQQEAERSRINHLTENEKNQEAKKIIDEAITLFEAVRSSEERAQKLDSYILQQLYEYSQELIELQKSENYSDTKFIFEEINQAVRYVHEVEAAQNGADVAVPEYLQKKSEVIISEGRPDYRIPVRLQRLIDVLESARNSSDYEKFPADLRADITNNLVVAQRLLREKNWNSRHRIESLRQFLNEYTQYIKYLDNKRSLEENEWEPGKVDEAFLALRGFVKKNFFRP